MLALSKCCEADTRRTMSRTTPPCPHPSLPSVGDTGLSLTSCSTPSTLLQPLGREAFGFRHNHIASLRDRPAGLPAGRGPIVPLHTSNGTSASPTPAQPTWRKIQSLIALKWFRKAWLRLHGVFISKHFLHLSSQFSAVLLWDFCSCKP